MTSTDEASSPQGPGNAKVSCEKLTINNGKKVEHTPPILLLLFSPVKEASPPYKLNNAGERRNFLH